MRRFRIVVAYALVAVTALHPVLVPLHSSSVRADEPLANSPGGGSVPSSPSPTSPKNLDGSSLQIIEQSNVQITFTGGTSGTPLSVSAEPIDPSIPSSYAYFANSIDGESSVLFVGGSSGGNIDARWMTATSVSTDDAIALQAMMMAHGGNSSNASFYDGFWSNYWHYLTNPSEMDDDLEIAFYGAMGTAAVAGTAAGGVAIWGAAGGATFGAGVVTTSETSVLFTVNGSTFMGTTTGLYNVTGKSWATMGYWTSITGIPILSAESAIAGAGGGLWIANHPCLSRAVQAFVNGWIP